MKRLWGGLLCGAAFFLLGCFLFQKPGIEEDEVTFATSYFRDWCFYALPLGAHHRLPLMHMSYYGALKTWLFAPIFWLCSPSVASIRLPAMFLGASTIVLFWLLLDHVHGRRAAIAGSVLLATDTIFLLTTTLDWGPDVLQHFLTVGAMLLAVLWYQTGRMRFIVAAAFCCGLAFWDKAVFGWMFAGLCAGSLIFIRGVLRRASFRAAALSVAALLAGALPLIVYNLATVPRFSTFGASSQLARPSFRSGWNALRATWNGSALFGLTNESAGSAGYHTNFIEPALIAAVLLLPFLWRTPARNPMLFSLIATAVGWAFMLRSGGGLAAHHIILLWPLPILFIAVALAQAGKWLLAPVLCFLAASNLLVTSGYVYRFSHFGSSDVWTDAVYPLAAGLKNSNASQAVVPDWGISDQLCVLNRNQPVAHPIPFPLWPADLVIFADKQAIWVERAPGHEITKGVNDGVLEAAAKAGYSPVMLNTYSDRYGREMFRTFRFQALARSP